MDRQQIGLKLALDALGRELCLDDFSNRLALQKTIYLIQAAGVDLGYSFSWYLRGPYSTGLTRDAFALKAELAQEPDAAKNWNLDAASLNRLRALRTLFTGVAPEKLPGHLELLASVLFIVKTRQATPSDIPKLAEILRQNDKPFSEAQIKEAIEELTRHGLCPRSTQ